MFHDLRANHRALARRVAVSALVVLAAASASVSRADDRAPSPEEARRVMDAALAYARQHEAPGGAIAVVDAGGALVLFERLPDSFPAASRVAIGKATTAAAFRRPTKAFEDAINGGRHSMTALPDFFPLQGGVPLVRGQVVVGAIGVSGAASAAQDTEIAEAGAAAMSAASPPAARAEGGPPAVSHLRSDAVERAFRVGAPLFEDVEVKVHASRRDAPGEAEVHVDDTDIFHVLAGRATFVTGGRLLGARTSSAGEMRGEGIEGGSVLDIAAGDVVVIPRGTPHWFRDVVEPVVYYVVKVPSGAREGRS